MESTVEMNNIVLHKETSCTVKGIASPDTKTAKDLLHVQKKTLSSQRTSKNWDLIIGVLILGLFLQIPTPQSDHREVAEDTKKEEEEGEYVGG